jgi:hypothetical protein
VHSQPERRSDNDIYFGGRVGEEELSKAPSPAGVPLGEVPTRPGYARIIV